MFFKKKEEKFFAEPETDWKERIGIIVVISLMILALFDIELAKFLMIAFLIFVAIYSYFDWKTKEDEERKKEDEKSWKI